MTVSLNRRSFLSALTASVGSACLVSVPGAEAAKAGWNSTCDVLVAGGGAAGCMAAIEAAKTGRKVILVQVLPFLGGSSAISSGWIRSTGTRWHAKRGISDSAEAYARDILDYGDGTRDPEKARMIARMSTEFVNYLMDIGVEFTDEEDRANGGDKLRVVKTKGAGSALMMKLAAKVQATKGITVVTESRIREVVLDASKSRVAGAVYEKGGKLVRVKAKAVVLATGGFGRNQDLIAKYCYQWHKTGRSMDAAVRGDGIKIATDLGAGSANLNIAMVCPTLEVTRNIFYSSAPLLNGGIIVNEKGRRFVNEYIIYTTTNIEMLKQKSTWEIVTRELHPTVDKMISAGVSTKCDTVEDIARKIGCDAAGLKADIEEHNRITAQAPADRHDRFGRTVYGKQLKAPFYVLQIKPVMIETVGGITINARSQVTTLLGKPVAAGLFAAGSLAFGEHFGRGYRSGDAYVYAGTTGMTAGREAAKIR